MLALLCSLALATPLTPDQARADVWHLTRLLEQSHPDPFLRGGGRVAFYQTVDEVLRGLPEGDIEPEALYPHLLPIVAQVGDGHTSLAPRHEAKPEPLGLGLTVVGDALVVSETARRDDGALLGLRIDTVAGLDVPTLLARQERLAGSDNAMHRLHRLARRLTTGVGRDALLDGAPPLIELVSLDGTRATYELGGKPDKQPLTMGSRWDLPAVEPHDLSWVLLDDDVAYLRIASMMRYREAFEIWRATGFESNLGGYLDRVAGSAVRRLAKDRDNRILQVPSATETFQELLAAMEREGATTLVVDLRGNQGGNSAISMVLGLFLATEEELLTAHGASGAYQIRRFSELFHAAHANAERPPGVPDGGYDFRVLHPTPSLEEQRAQLRQYLEAMPTLKAAHDAGPLHTAPRPTLKVLVDAGTYSAGFDLVRLLDSLGAELVGVPSSQSGNCFIDSVPFHLQHSRLTGSMSTKWSVAYPDAPARGELLPMDRSLTWEGWGKLDFDPHAVIDLALE